MTKNNLPAHMSREDLRDYYFDRGKPSVEKVSKKEIYLLDDAGERSKRICGHRLKGMPKGYLCLNNSGFRTSHKGVGYCRYHSDEDEGQTWLQQIKRMETPLSTILEDQKDLSVKLTDVTEEIQVLQSAVTLYIQNAIQHSEKNELSPSDIDKVVKYTRDITRTKEAGARIRGSTQLEQSTVLSFVDQLYSIIIEFLRNKNVEEPIIAELLRVIADKVVDTHTNDNLAKGEIPVENEEGDISLEKDNEIQNAT